MAGIVAYLEDTYNELVNKVSWPAWKDLQSSAVVVLVASLCFAFVVFLMDFIFGIRTGGGESGFVWKGVLGFFYSMFN
jgi:preprotein translocase subunit SecE